MFMTAMWKRSWNRDGADRRLHRIDGGGCRREIKVSFKAENPYTTFSKVSFAGSFDITIGKILSS